MDGVALTFQDLRGADHDTAKVFGRGKGQDFFAVCIRNGDSCSSSARAHIDGKYALVNYIIKCCSI